MVIVPEISKHKNIIKIFPEAWFSDDKNSLHYLFKINQKYKNGEVRYPKIHISFLEEIDGLLGFLINEELISKDIKNKLYNPPQFGDTLTEIKVVSYLFSNGMEPKFGKAFPDIEIPSHQIIIEVKNLHSSQKFLESEGGVVELDDISRIWAKVSEEFLPKIDDDKINIILFEVPPEVEFDEFEDLFIYSVKVYVDKRTMKPARYFKGEFSKEENSKISAVIMLYDGSYEGIINPLNNKNIPEEIKGLFNLKEYEVKIDSVRH